MVNVLTEFQAIVLTLCVGMIALLIAATIVGGLAGLGRRGIRRGILSAAVLSLGLVICLAVGGTKNGAADESTGSLQRARRRLASGALGSAESGEDEVSSGLRFTTIAKTDSGVALTLAFPEDVNYVDDSVALHMTDNLTNDSWRAVASFDSYGNPAESTLVLTPQMLGANMWPSSAFFKAVGEVDVRDRTIDSDGDGLTDYEEERFGSNPYLADTDDDGLSDYDEHEYGSDPTNPDTDNDGLSDGEEDRLGTDPTNVDTDGDGVDDGIEIEQGTIATDRTDVSATSQARWVEVVGDLPHDDVKTNSTVVTVSSNSTYFVGVFVASEEYPQFTDVASEYNDVLTWTVSAPGYIDLNQTVYVNNEDGEWDAAVTNGCCLGEFDPVVLKDGAIVETGSTNIDVSVVVTAMNVWDSRYASSVHVGIFPLRMIQPESPRGCGADGTTDSGRRHTVLVRRGGIAYISADPALPTINAQFRDLPEWVNVEWSGNLRTERSDVRPVGIDDREFISTNLLGAAWYDITQALANEIIGGRCALNVQIAGRYTGSHPFYIRGKNPKDADARAFIDASVDDKFLDFAWRMAKHETKSGRNRFYNQFNVRNGYDEKPNRGGNGWGIGQIDNGEDQTLTTTATLYNWHTNVLLMAERLTDRNSAANRFIGYYRSEYGNHPNWSEPPSTNISDIVISAEMWSTMTLYNGGGTIPAQELPGRRPFQSPLCFDTNTWSWVFYNNRAGTGYVEAVITDSLIGEVE